MRNWTVPVGVVPLPVPATVAVKVIASPKTDGFGLEVRFVVVGAGPANSNEPMSQTPEIGRAIPRH
jgi:hypothetical protein